MLNFRSRDIDPDQKHDTNFGVLETNQEPTAPDRRTGMVQAGAESNKASIGGVVRLDLDNGNDLHRQA
jgi:hypothetical protein